MSNYNLLQLLEIFSDIEVANLALLQQSQDVEGSLESLKAKLRETRTTNDAEIKTLRSTLGVRSLPLSSVKPNQ
jgi:hypothetical protein